MMEYFFPIDSKQAYDFFIQFKEFLLLFKEKVNFVPKFNLLSFEDNNDKKLEVFKKRNCYSKGKFCIRKNDFSSSFQLLNEAINQICAWKIVNGDLDQKIIWFDYIEKYQKFLSMRNLLDLSSQNFDYKIDEKISSSAVKDIDNCFKQSFNNFEDKFESDNSVLESAFVSTKIENINEEPIIIINSEMFQGELTVLALIENICDKLIDKSGFCENFTENTELKYIQRMFVLKKILNLFFILLIICVVLFLCYFIALKQIERRMIKHEIEMKMENKIESRDEIN